MVMTTKDCRANKFCSMERCRLQSLSIFTVSPHMIGTVLEHISVSWPRLEKRV